ncbi:Uncharacterised protein [Pannonibacter phragmitetus]|uniref:Uncharacterized protein n=1 Tax=Pannonibacter phragmitetus TaxID=121719 RepID=A0A379A1J0_9HYPH|nr:hypothetical protein [Pannonibacter phragmitetus]SUB02940.1 Uncharacterised protein [Pannonibacter phragmitetus]
MIQISDKTLDIWMADFDSFNYEFRRFCLTQFRIHGIEVNFVPNVLKQIHDQWIADHQSWLENETDDQTKQLSHVKICALLLANLVSEPFLGNFYPHTYTDAPDHRFNGNAKQKEKAKRDLIDGREISLSLDFVILVIDWHERYRTDREQEYKQPLTEDMRHDLINYLIGNSSEKKAIYLILKALYLRPNGNGKSN